MTDSHQDIQRIQLEHKADLYRHKAPEFAHWAAGYGVIKHQAQTQVRVYELIDMLAVEGLITDKSHAYKLLSAADRVASAAMWLVVHMSYTRRIFLDGRDLRSFDFKPQPKGFLGGALNMVPAYVGYMAINALSGITRSWVMEQGHCVAAIDAVNVLLGNLKPAQAERYQMTEEGLSKLAADFYACELTPEGIQKLPISSRVSVHTAGGMSEGGYLGVTGLQYMHQPLPGERLVAFLSDGAFEEQRGSDWAPRWWRAEDTGLVMPVMIANGRRIDQCTTTALSGECSWLEQYLWHQHYDPLIIDGTDPAAFAWSLYEMEQRLGTRGEALLHGKGRYPVRLPYTIAVTTKGYGFAGAGTSRAHTSPLEHNPAKDAEGVSEFNTSARRLWVPLVELLQSIALLNNHELTERPREADSNTLQMPIKVVMPELFWLQNLEAEKSSVAAFDLSFAHLAKINPQLRVRVGNPDQLQANHLYQTLDFLRHRVCDPHPGQPEAVNGSVITALNEEAVVSAALANAKGLNLVVSYEAFATKMLGILRQMLTFNRRKKQADMPIHELSMGLLLTSLVWENGEHEHSHQDPTFVDALINEPADIARVVFPLDWNCALATLEQLFQSHGQLWTMVMAKTLQPQYLSMNQACQLVSDGAICLKGNADESLQLVAIGSFQLAEIMKASVRLATASIEHSVVYIFEPGRLREGRDRWEKKHQLSAEYVQRIFGSLPEYRLFVVHGHPEPWLAVLRTLDLGPERTRALGYINHGGTLDTPGMLFANKTSWAHILFTLIGMMDLNVHDLLSADEVLAVQGRGNPKLITDPAIHDHSLPQED
ncbi:xylulose 5-phosphate 3-epimerase [Zooshikella marina]|uniref:xylulose 5-phosphate 3-epimerase n=1 Tax=Zooshikella ganghwensis TaxID=202772 RepID=UPI001BAF9014|nr:xylulose 5-phosphate 3-epimerase [Zooshikella ganghwensis]MBU2707144.1 xylulose 5-phosphate 3-epimerase [Zooshikella ganghwensis]